MGDVAEVNDAEVDALIDAIEGENEGVKKKGLTTWQIAILTIAVVAMLIIGFGLLRYFMVRSYGP